MKLRNEILTIKELKNTYKSESFVRLQEPNNTNQFVTITKRKVNKSNKGNVIGLRVWDVKNGFYHPKNGSTEFATNYEWVYENN